MYPFHDGKFEDFEPVFEYLIKVRPSSLPQASRPLTNRVQNDINDGTSNEYTNAFFPTAEKLIARADAETLVPDRIALYLRACALLRIARFPYITAFPTINSRLKWDAWEMQKEAYQKAGRLFARPVEEVRVPHEHADGRDRDMIPVYVRVPEGGEPHPVVILMTGLDGYRPDNTVRCDEFLERGWGSVVVEIPGTADCPADSADPESPDRLWDSLLAWMARDGRFDMRRVMVWGLSSGGYYAVRVAHTHREKLRGVVAQGAGCHYFFDKSWLEKADGHEYPFQ